MESVFSMLVGAFLIALGCTSAMAQAGQGCPKSARSHHHRQTTRSEIRRGDQGERLGLEGLVAPARMLADLI
jgi:hypothetical protein